MTHNACLFAETTGALTFATAVGVDTGTKGAVYKATVVVRTWGVLDEATVTTWNGLEDATTPLARAATWRLPGTRVAWAEDGAAFIRTVGVARISPAQQIARGKGAVGVTDAADVTRIATAAGLAKSVAWAEDGAAFIRTTRSANVAATEDVAIGL